ncbi:MAG: hypothetical protein IJ533_03820 [Prevotella sp.]|nr:hypothetical protein [Prevotella sp.]
MMKKAVLLGQRSAAFLPEKRYFFPRGAPFVLIFRNPNRSATLGRSPQRGKNVSRTLGFLKINA